MGWDAGRIAEEMEQRGTLDKFVIFVLMLCSECLTLKTSTVPPTTARISLSTFS